MEYSAVNVMSMQILHNYVAKLTLAVSLVLARKLDK